jgi:hypothetical protein
MASAAGRNVTSPDQQSLLGSRPSVPRESYAPASQDARSLIFQPFGPRMQVAMEIRAPKRVYRFNGAFVVSLEYLDDGGTIFASHRDLPVHGYGESLAEATEAFSTAFDLQYRTLVEQDDQNLSPYARELREKLRSAVAHVSEK